MPGQSAGSSSHTAPFATLVDVLRWRAIHQPDRLAHRFLLDGEFDEVSLTYEALDKRARAIAALLQSLGKSGDRALLLFPPGLDFVAAYFACLYSNIIAIPAYPPHPARLDKTLPRISGIIHDATPVLALTTGSLSTSIDTERVRRPELRAMKWAVTDGIEVDAWAGKWEPPEIGGDDIAFLQYTSGSTAAPRGVMVSHGNLMHNLDLIRTCFGDSPESHGVAWLPPYHDMGLIGGILHPLHCGFPVTLMSPVMFLQRPYRWLQAISRFRATLSAGPNFAYDLCVRKILPDQRTTLDLSSWEVALNGSERIEERTLEQFAGYFAECGFRPETFVPCYGLAESTLFVSGRLQTELPAIQTLQTSALGQNRVVVAACGGEDTQRMVSSGQRIADQEFRIVDPEKLEPCRPDQIGEIWVRGPSVASGYWNKPSETDRTFRAHLAGSNDGPFLRTGDLGFLHDGQLFVTGRLKDLIIIDGGNHYPQDIEETVRDCHPAIRPAGCAAFSIDGEGGERLVVVVEIESRRAVNAAEVAGAVRKAVTENHELHVHDIRLTRPGGIPRTTSGKIRRFLCRTNYLAGTLEEIA